MSDPKVVALDEPTSGMDSLTSYIIINELKTLAKAGKTIFLTIHQPNSEIFELFDKLLLMIDGRIIYQGRNNNTEAYFSDQFNLPCPTYMNPADHFISIIHHEDEKNVQRYP
jgi:ABC-type multidrug transport system ATPase subunit